MKRTRPGQGRWTLALCLSVCACASSGQALRPFSSDGCSLFPDGDGKQPELWQACCVRHDLAYWRGGSAAERLQADAALRDCVFEQSGDRLLAGQMYRGVRLGGTPALPTGFRWAYGWPYGRGYQALTEAERAAAAADPLASACTRQASSACVKD